MAGKTGKGLLRVLFLQRSGGLATSGTALGMAVSLYSCQDRQTLASVLVAT